MIYPMPENMGFPLPRTVGEMLPDQPLVMPDGTRGRYKHISQASLRTYTCAECGKVFDAGAEYKYRAGGTKGNPVIMFCSYPCFRPTERAMQEKFKRDTLMNTYAAGTDECNLAQARQRVKHCENRLAELRAQRDDPAVWEALPVKKRNTVTTLISRWMQKLDDARAALKEIEAYETA